MLRSSRTTAPTLVLANRSDLDLGEQVTATGATWLDHRLVERDPMPLAMGGYGRETRDAMEARTEHLVQEGLARRQGQRIILQRDLLDTLRRRELDQVAAKVSADTGLPHVKAASGEHVAGTYRQRLTLTSGRFAMIDNGLGFQLVPWSRELDKSSASTSLASSRTAVASNGALVASATSASSNLPNSVAERAFGMSGTKILWGQVIVVGLIVLLAIWGATEWTAWRLAWQPELGRPWFELSGFKIYYPPVFFWWWFVFDVMRLRSLLRAPSSRRRGPSFRLRRRSACRSGGRVKPKMSRPMARRAGPMAEEVRAAGLLGPDGVVLGKLDSDYLRHDGPEHVLCFGYSVR